MMKRIFSLVCVVGMAAAVLAQNPVVFDFKSTSDTSGAYSGSLANGATLTTLGTYGVLSLGANDGYFNLGAQFGSMMKGLGESFTISVYAKRRGYENSEVATATINLASIGDVNGDGQVTIADVTSLVNIILGK
ncbi:MAG: hypothetical protein J5682_00735 [Prevotella sp.]|nr:hypothetical protein [Prevotella sp.]